MVGLEDKLSRYVIEINKLARHNAFVYRWLSRAYPFETKRFTLAQDIYTNLLIGGIAFVKAVKSDDGMELTYHVIDNQDVKIIPRKVPGVKKLISPSSKFDLNHYDQIGPVMIVPPLWPLVRILLESNTMKILSKPNYDWEKLKEFKEQADEILRVPPPEEDVYALLVKTYLERLGL